MKIEYVISSLLTDIYFPYSTLNHTLYFIIIYRNYPQIDVLFNFLKEQEPTVAAAAYTAMICGLAKHLNVR